MLLTRTAADRLASPLAPHPPAERLRRSFVPPPPDVPMARWVGRKRAERLARRAVAIGGVGIAVLASAGVAWTALDDGDPVLPLAAPREPAVQRALPRPLVPPVEPPAAVPGRAAAVVPAARAAAPSGPIGRGDLRLALAEEDLTRRFPTHVKLAHTSGTTRARLSYTLERDVQKGLLDIVARHNPDYASVAAIEARTGRVLALVTHTRSGRGTRGNLGLRATFPAASVFKLVTAAAAIDAAGFHPASVIPFDGGMHSLHPSNVFDRGQTSWAHYVTLEEAFGKSINTVFAKIGIQHVGAAGLTRYAECMGFNRPFDTDVPLATSTTQIADDGWAIAQAASGYTRQTRISPLHGAVLAATVVNDGVVPTPWMIDAATDADDGRVLYRGGPQPAGRCLASRTTTELRTLMRETVSRGTGRRGFQGFADGPQGHLDVGGKTGSLTGDDPPGKYDWFVGYADAGPGDEPIAVAAVTINVKAWRVRASYLARRTIELRYDDRSPTLVTASAEDLGSFDAAPTVVAKPDPPVRKKATKSKSTGTKAKKKTSSSKTKRAKR